MKRRFHTRTHTAVKHISLTFVVSGVFVKGDVAQVQDGCRQVHEIGFLLRCHPNAVHGCHHHLETTDIIQGPITSGSRIEILQHRRVKTVSWEK